MVRSRERDFSASNRETCGESQSRGTVGVGLHYSIAYSITQTFPTNGTSQPLQRRSYPTIVYPHPMCTVIAYYCLQADSIVYRPRLQSPLLEEK